MNAPAEAAAARKPSKQDQNPKMGACAKGTDSPPSLSLTASPEKTTEKKLANLSFAQKQKTANSHGKPQRAPLNFRCSDCGQEHAAHFLPYEAEPAFGNCTNCGQFRDLTAILQAHRSGYAEATLRQHLVEGIRPRDQRFRAEVPMDRIMDRLVECQTLGKLFNPTAFYIRTREFYVDWMSQLCGELQHQPETFHHSVSTFDAYMQLSDIKKHI